MFKKPLTRKRKIIYIVLGSFIVLLIAFRIALPYILLKYVNRQLARIDGYYGHVDDIDVSLYRGAYTIDHIKLDKVNGKISVPFFEAREIDLSVEWSALFKGEVVAEIIVESPVMNFVKGPSKETSQTDIDKDWTQVVDKLIPLKLNRFEINNGQVHYRDFHSSPKVNIYAKQIQIVAENLSNAQHKEGALPSDVTATAAVYDGKLSLNMKIDPINTIPVFDMNARLTSVNLTHLNDFLRAYGNFDVEKGELGLYTEAAAKDKRISGYTKPVIKDLKVLSWKNDKDKPARMVWEAVVEAVGWVFKNHSKDQLATKASFEGSIENPDFDIWNIIGQLLRNAFIEALYPSLENSVNINTVGAGKEEKPSLLKRIFTDSKKK